MPQSASRHPFRDLFASALFPHITHAADHSKDPPPVEHLLPPGFSAPELRELIDHFIAADHDVREDRLAAAARNLDVTETRLRLAITSGRGARPAYEAALGDIAIAREAIGRKDSAHACGAIGNAVRALAAAAPKG
jgi:hypothetical protein